VVPLCHGCRNLRSAARQDELAQVSARGRCGRDGESSFAAGSGAPSQARSVGYRPIHVNVAAPNSDGDSISAAVRTSPTEFAGEMDGGVLPPSYRIAWKQRKEISEQVDSPPTPSDSASRIVRFQTYWVDAGPEPPRTRPPLPLELAVPRRSPTPQTPHYSRAGGINIHRSLTHTLEHWNPLGQLPLQGRHGHPALPIVRAAATSSGDQLLNSTEAEHPRGVSDTSDPETVRAISQPALVCCRTIHPIPTPA
jgi:hypothetical protein